MTYVMTSTHCVSADCANADLCIMKTPTSAVSYSDILFFKQQFVDYLRRLHNKKTNLIDLNLDQFTKLENNL